MISSLADYPDYGHHYESSGYDQAQVKYEDDDEQKYKIPDNTNGSSRNDYDDYEEGEAY